MHFETFPHVESDTSVGDPHGVGRVGQTLSDHLTTRLTSGESYSMAEVPWMSEMSTILTDPLVLSYQTLRSGLPERLPCPSGLGDPQPPKPELDLEPDW